MSLTKEEKRKFRKNDILYFCEEEMSEGPKVRDHCHLTGKHGGPAHQSCNLNFKLPSFVPVFLHNKAYDDTSFYI